MSSIATELQLPEQVDVPVETVVRRKLKPKDFLGRRAALSDCQRIVRDPIILQESGLRPTTKIVSLQLKDYGVDLDALTQQLARIEYGSLNRVGGTAAVAEPLQRVFGYMPRKTGHRDYCTASSLAWQDAEAHSALEQAAQVCEHFYRLTNPKLHTQHLRQSMNRVRAEYHLSNGIFTSGIVNRNNPLPYHYDTGNFASVWSAMLVFKSSGYEGGYLSVPEYDMAFELKDHSLFMFDGQGLIHGVTPVLPGADAVYRYSIVYYSLRMMWKCLTTSEEVEMARVIRTDREQRRAGIAPSAVSQGRAADARAAGSGLFKHVVRGGVAE